MNTPLVVQVIAKFKINWIFLFWNGALITEKQTETEKYMVNIIVCRKLGQVFCYGHTDN